MPAPTGRYTPPPPSQWIIETVDRIVMAAVVLVFVVSLYVIGQGCCG